MRWLCGDVESFAFTVCEPRPYLYELPGWVPNPEKNRSRVGLLGRP